MNFLNFLMEAAKDASPDIKALNVKSAINLLNEKCKDALWMLHKDTPIYRADPKFKKMQKRGFAISDPSLTERIPSATDSFHGLSFYTMMLDNHPERSEFPKRSRSYIGTFNFSYAAEFYARDDVKILIPFDGVKIGCVNTEDLWDRKIKSSLFSTNLYKHELPNLDQLNTVLADLINDLKDFMLKTKNIKVDINLKNVEHSFENMKNAIKRLEQEWDKMSPDDEKKFINSVNVTFDDFSRIHRAKLVKALNDKSLWDKILEMYSPASTNHTWCTTKTMKRNQKGEVWIGGPCVVITVEMWREMLNEK